MCLYVKHSPFNSSIFIACCNCNMNVDLGHEQHYATKNIQIKYWSSFQLYWDLGLYWKLVREYALSSLTLSDGLFKTPLGTSTVGEKYCSFLFLRPRRARVSRLSLIAVPSKLFLRHDYQVVPDLGYDVSLASLLDPSKLAKRNRGCGIELGETRRIPSNRTACHLYRGWIPSHPSSCLCLRPSPSSLCYYWSEFETQAA